MDRALQRWGQLGPARARAREGPRRSLRAGGSRRLRRLRRRRLDGWFSVGRAGWLVLPPPPGYSPLEHRVHDGSLTNEDHWRALLDSNQWPSASESARGESTTLPESPQPSSNRTVSAEAGSPGTPFLPPVPKDFVTRSLPERRAEPPLLTVRQVAARLGVCTATVYRLCDEGQLRHVRVLHAIHIAPEEVHHFIDAHSRRRKP